MIYFNCTEERWRNVIDHMVDLAKGNLNKRIEIKHVNDPLETIEAVLNWVTDEWRQRVLQMTFTKPSEAQKFINHFQIILDRDMVVQSVDQDFLQHLNIQKEHLLFKSLSDYITESDFKKLRKYLKKIDRPNFRYTQTPQIELMDMTFMYTVKKLATTAYVLNLFHIQTHLKHFRKGLSKEPKEFIRYQQKKVYRDRIADIKKHIDHMPLKELLILENVCKKYMVNSLQLKKGFRELYQCSPYDYFLKRRMNHAYLLIQTSTLSLKEISQMVGYAQYSTFSKKFTRTYDISPKDLRKQMLSITTAEIDEKDQ